MKIANGLDSIKNLGATAKMERRNFLKYTSLAATGFALTACGQDNLLNLFKGDRSSKSSQAVNFGKLEKTYLTLGIAPVMDCAPIIIAKENGLFERYGLTVGFSKKGDWAAVEEGLRQGELDASIAPFGLPMLGQLGSTKTPIVSLMMLNLNGRSITLAKQAWEAGIRPSIEYFKFSEFAESYRKYIRKLEEPAPLAIESTSSMDNYLSRYWLSTMGINPDQEVDLVEFPPSQMIYKIKAGMVDGYCVGSPWNQQAALEKAGFTSYVSRDIWQGHPGKVLATMQAWLEENPNTARALVAAVLEACQFCDQPENRRPPENRQGKNPPSIAEVLAQSKYLDTNLQYIEPSLLGNYHYGGFDGQERVKKIPDFYLFHYKKDTDYLNKPDHANYPWRSHAVWLLTQMIRWNQIEMNQYPADADQIIDRIYPLKVYEDVAEALNIPLPSDRLKVEPAEVFIDRREFDPSQPVQYLNSFAIRAGRPQFFALGEVGSGEESRKPG
ncbi:MAG: CmpA/NrtA family ABC transporter substrate-binding protein [Coleofasciculaceae cyanobacterium]